MIDGNIVAQNLCIYEYDKKGDREDPNTPRTDDDANLSWIITMGNSPRSEF